MVDLFSQLRASSKSLFLALCSCFGLPISFSFQFILTNIYWVWTMFGVLINLTVKIFSLWGFMPPALTQCNYTIPIAAKWMTLSSSSSSSSPNWFSYNLISPCQSVVPSTFTVSQPRSVEFLQSLIISEIKTKTKCKFSTKTLLKTLQPW